MVIFALASPLPIAPSFATSRRSKYYKVSQLRHSTPRSAVNTPIMQLFRHPCYQHPSSGATLPSRAASRREESENHRKRRRDRVCATRAQNTIVKLRSSSDTSNSHAWEKR
ncbi:hypothetical protein U1Q18_047169 [Sarracenia purpurea var. burkii]